MLPGVEASSRRGRRGRQGAGLGFGNSGARGGEWWDRQTQLKNWRSRVASLKLWPGSAASPANRSDYGRVAISSQSATRSLS